MDKEKLIRDLLCESILCTIATVSRKSQPESAVIAFCELDNLELLFGTYNTTRKYQNIQANSHVAFVIGWDHSKTIQYEGIASECSNGEELDKYKQRFFTKNPSSARFESDSMQRYFKVIPTWIRYTDYNTTPETIFEIPF